MNSITNANTNHPDAAGLIRDQWKLVQGSNEANLDRYKAIGDALNDQKKILKSTGKGAFGQWLDEQGFPFDKRQAQRMMQFAANHDEIMKADAKASSKSLFNLEKLLANWSKAKRAASADEQGEPEGSPLKAKPLSGKALIELQKENISRMIEEIKALKAELAAKPIAASLPAPPKSDKDFGPYGKAGMDWKEAYYTKADELRTLNGRLAKGHALVAEKDKRISELEAQVARMQSGGEAA